MRNRVIAYSVIFYAAVLALLLGVLFKEWAHVLPKSLATRIGHNSEGYVLILAIAPWIQFVRERIRGTKAEWFVVAVASIAFFALTWWLLNDHAMQDPANSRFKTLNEGTLAAGLLIPYVQVRRPLPRRLAAILVVVILVGVAITNRSAVTTDLAETWGMLLLAVIGFDLVDKGILDPAAVTSTVTRWIWYAVLVVAPIVFSVSEYDVKVGSTGIIGEPVRFLVRITEAFIFALFTQVFFAVLLGRKGRAAGDPQPAADNRVPVGAA